MHRSLWSFFALLFAVALCSATPALAQQTVSGVVTDAATGDPLIGATVTVPGTTVGAATDLDGVYRLDVPATADSLQFSYIGYESQTVAIDGRSTIDVALGQSAQALGDLVVIG